MKRISIIATMTFLCLLLGTTQAGAEQPANPICEGTIGVANGLCTAATEIGCGTDEERNAQACARIEEQYLKVTGQIPPWLVECPCWTPEILQAGGEIDQCLSSDPEDPSIAAISWHGDGFACSGELCAVRGELSCGIHYTALGQIIIESPITIAEHGACRAQILALCEGFPE